MFEKGHFSCWKIDTYELTVRDGPKAKTALGNNTAIKDSTLCQRDPARSVSTKSPKD